MSKFIFLKSLRELLMPLKRLIDKKAENLNWNENDPNSNSYISGRTHYKEEKKVFLLNNTKFDFFNWWDDIYGAELPIPSVNAGDIVNVIWDETEYKCTVGFADGDFAIGNASLIGLGADTGEPFLWMFASNYSEIYTLDTISSHAISCYSITTVIHKIPFEYLDVEIKDASYDTAGISKLSNPSEIDYNENAGTIGINYHGQLVPVIHPHQDRIFKGTPIYSSNMDFLFWGKRYPRFLNFSEEMSSKKCIFGFDKITNGYVQIRGFGGHGFSFTKTEYVCDVLSENGVKYIEPNIKLISDTNQNCTIYLNRIDENGVFYFSVDPNTAVVDDFRMTIQSPFFAWCYEIDDDVLSDNIARITNVIPSPATASVGQTLVVKSVDESGKPTEWETIDPHILTDTETGKKYQLSVVNGKLTMTEVE